MVLVQYNIKIVCSVGTLLYEGNQFRDIQRYEIQF